MTNIIEFKRAKKAKATKKQEVMSYNEVEQWLENDIQKLMEATGKDHEDAIQMASDFYYGYPALIEHVRSIEFMANRK